MLVLILTLSFISVKAEQKNKKVILGGIPFGLKAFTNGVMVIEVNENNSPAKDVGIKVNDVIINANNTSVKSNEDLKNIIENSNGKTVNMTIIRDNKEISKCIVPKKDEGGIYTAGMWIRDSTAGIGTITYFDQTTHKFGALGHGICDKDTGMLMPIRNGDIIEAKITNYTKGSSGNLGGLDGYFESTKIGDISINNAYGVYGDYEYSYDNEIIEVARDDEIEKGKAKIVSTISSEGPKEYSVEIIKVNTLENSGQNMIIKVTDKELLSKTGGIVQGMSGSPIIQNDKLVGAVTHVFINSPHKGYGISISNMLSNH